MAVASWSWELRARKNESISSMNMIQGCNLSARVKTAAASFCDSPYHLSVRAGTSRLINLQIGRTHYYGSMIEFMNE